jgi:hypothetical protein
VQKLAVVDIQASLEVMLVLEEAEVVQEVMLVVVVVLVEQDTLLERLVAPQQVEEDHSRMLVLVLVLQAEMEVIYLVILYFLPEHYIMELHLVLPQLD